MIINPYAFGGGGGGGSYLDGLAVTPRMALSMKKKLISTATNAYRVRESAGSTEQDIGFSGGAVDSSALASFVGSNSGYLRALYDQTGNGEDAYQATAANQPRLVNAGVADAMATPDGSSDSLKIDSLTTGAAQVGIYMKFKMPTGSGVKILFEQSTNYNSNTQDFVVYYDGSLSNKLNVAMQNGVGAIHQFSYAVTPGASVLLSLLLDRTQTGTGEALAWVNGSTVGGGFPGGTTEQTGVFSSYDCYLFARAGTSLYADGGLESLVTYNADTSAIRTAIESIMA